LRAAQNHPHYVGNNNESVRRDQLIASNPPEGGLRAYLSDLQKSADSSSLSSLEPPAEVIVAGPARRVRRTEKL
jgi:hypothetical protein